MNIRASSVVLLELLHEVWSWCILAKMLSLLAGNAYAFAWLDVRYVSCQGVCLPVALISEFQSMRTGDSTTREHVAAMNGVVRAKPNRPADDADGAKDRGCLASRWRCLLAPRSRWQRAYGDKQGTYCKA
jgi:hypothetical protein